MTAIDDLSAMIVSWSTTYELDNWVNNGGRLFVQGLGEMTRTKVGGILETLSRRLETLSWGSAEKYRLVLSDLTASVSD